jgi:hypothetical protein
MQCIRYFQNSQQQGVIMGEFTISNLSETNDCAHSDDWQSLADGVFAKMKTSTQEGALLWNYDCQSAAWGMSDSAFHMCINWDLSQF